MAALGAFLCALLWLAKSEATVSDQKLAIPAYFYPSGDGTDYWNSIAKANRVGIAVVNPNSGPGSTSDSNYVKVITDSINAGHKVIGYVDTGYFGVTGRTTRSGSTSADDWMVQIKQDIDTFYNFYGSAGLSGIFLDDGLNECGANNQYVNWYKELYDYINNQHSGGFVVINPGSGTDQCYASVADVILVFEHDLASYQTWQQPSWSQNQANGAQFWHLIYGVTNQQDMETVMALAKTRNAGYVYVTNDDLPNPWDTLPPNSYWEAELTKTQS